MISRDTTGVSLANGTLILTGNAISAFTFFGYALCGGEIDLKGKIPDNHIEALKKAYVDAFWNGVPLGTEIT